MNERTLIITGGSRGIGKSIALLFASSGYSIAIIYAGNDEKARETVKECRAFSVKAEAYKCNVASSEEVKETVAAIRKEFTGISVLVNNAGITRDGIAAMMKDGDWNDVIDTNLRGPFLMIRNTIPLFLRNKDGRIINISSVSGLMGNPGQANYSASKAGLIGLTKSIARELAQKNITCNAIAPGFIRTDMTKNLENTPLISSIPLGRMGDAEDIARTALFLASSPYITGEVIRVDGGLAM